MKRIAVVLAYNPRNAGMFSVDLAASHFFSNLGIPVEFFCAQDPEGFGVKKYGAMSVNVVKDHTEIFENDIVIYWGDFTTNIQYGVNDFLNWDRIFLGLSPQLSFDRWRSIFLPSDSYVKSGGVAFSVGQNFQSLRFAEGRIRLDAFRDKYNNFRGIYPRDARSLEEIVDFTGREDSVFLGLDPAFLLNKVRFQRAIRPGKVTMCFGRSGFGNTNLISDFFRKNGFNVVDRSDWLNLRSFNRLSSFYNLLDDIRSSELVVSDVYHFLVNSIREGIPVIGLGRQQDAQKTTVSDFKKQQLFKDLGISEFYFSFPEGEIDWSNFLSSFVRGGGTVAHLHSRIANFEARVAGAIQEVWEKS